MGLFFIYYFRQNFILKKEEGSEAPPERTSAFSLRTKEPAVD